MLGMKFKTKGNSLPNKKPRVYFTCHPDDFDKSFNKVCEDIFKTHDCAIYYTEDMTEAFDEKDLDIDLGSMNMFVIPVTFKLLTKPNRAMDFDFAYAKKEHIPVLPIMMESGIDEFYSKPNKFGELQYLNPYSTDLTEIGYEEKLKKYLESVLISDEMAKRVRAAFDAYIFLSYRKKDRRYANELMKLIHAKPEFRDIAIWYDEFLMPGESFNENIGKMLNDSKLFTLLVTPNLLEEPNGKPNYVMGEEYPMAKRKGMDILPAEMEDTDKDELNCKFDGIPECVNPYDDEAFKQRLLKSISKIATSENDNDPEHNFLIGLAYLEGIDVEVNRERGIELITKAADVELPEAMLKLFLIYSEGIYVKLNYHEALKWGQKLTNYYINVLGEENQGTLLVLSSIASTYDNLGEHQKAFELYEKIYVKMCGILGEEHQYTIIALNNLAYAYAASGQHQKAIELNEKAYVISCNVLGEDHSSVSAILNNLAHEFGKLGELRKSLELYEKAYAISCNVQGEKHPSTLMIIANQASIYRELGEYQKAIKFNEKAYVISSSVLGEEHPKTLTILNNLASTYADLGEYQRAYELTEKVYIIRCKILGEEHPDTLASLNNLASIYNVLGEHQKALELNEKAYVARCKILGEEHPDTLTSLNNLAGVYSAFEEHEKALELVEKSYIIRCKILGEEHPDTLTSLNNLAFTYNALGEHKKALELNEKVYIIRCKILGEEHPDTLKALDIFICANEKQGNIKKLLELYKKAYMIRCNVWGKEHRETLISKIKLEQFLYLLSCKLSGEEHPDTLNSLNSLAVTYSKLGEHQKALELAQKVYELQCKVLGEDHPNTQKFKDMLKKLEDIC